MNGFAREEVDRLIRLANARGLTYVRIESGDREIVLEFGRAPSAAAAPLFADPADGTETAVIKSGYVGYFRHEAEVGASVGAGDVVGIVEALGLPNVSVRRARGEELGRTIEVDVVAARAVAPLGRLIGWSLPLLCSGGRLLALKGDRADDELAVARPMLKKAGAVAAEVVTVGSAEQLTQARVVVVTRGVRR